MGIKRACFVDDQFSPMFPKVFAVSRRIVDAGGATELRAAWSCGTWTAESEDDDRADAQRRWDALDGDLRGALFKRLATITSDPVPAELTFFSDSWPHPDCPLEEIGPERFDEVYIREHVLDQGPSLLFVDVSLGGANEEGGLTLLRKVRTLDTESKTICVLLTNRPEAEAGPQSATDYWDNLVKDKKVDSGAAVVISKKATRDVLEFEAELRRAFLNGISPDLLQWGSRVAARALEIALLGIRIEGDVLNEVVLASSEREGVHPTETLFRLIDHRFRDERDRLAVSQDELAKFGSFKSKLEALAKLTPPREAVTPLAVRVKQLRSAELYRTRMMSDWPTSVSLGDLWNVTLAEGSKERVEQFVLIAPQCDIVLRADGKRSQEWVLLAPIVERNDGHPETTVELKYFNSEFESCRVNLKKARVANVNVLDLVAIAGARIDKATIARLHDLPHVHASVGKRAELLASWLDQVLKPPPDTSSLALFQGPGPGSKLTITADSVDFHCECVRRIEPEFAGWLLQRYGNFVARHALLHDFGNVKQ